MPDDPRPTTPPASAPSGDGPSASVPAPLDVVGEPGATTADTGTTGAQPDDQAVPAQTGEPGTADVSAAVEPPAGQSEADESGAAEPGPTTAAAEPEADSTEPEADSTEPETTQTETTGPDATAPGTADSAATQAVADSRDHPQPPDRPGPAPTQPGSAETSADPVPDATAPGSSAPAEPVAEPAEAEPAEAEPAEVEPDRSPLTAAQPSDGSTPPDAGEASAPLTSGEPPWDPLDPSSPIEIDGDDRWFEDLREHGPATWWHDQPQESSGRLPLGQAPQPGVADTTGAVDQPWDGEDDDLTTPADQPVVSDWLREDYASAAAPARSPDEQPGEPTGAARVPAEPAVPDVSPRMRLLRAMRPRATRAQGLAMLLCFVLGLAGFLAVRQNQNLGLTSMRQSDLVSLLDNLTEKSTRLEEETRRLQGTADKLRSGTDKSAAALDAAKQRLDLLGILAGTSPAVGPGIELSITDPKNQVNSRILLDALQELRDAGAEAMQIGGVRVVASTSLVDANGGVRVDGTLLAAPYTLLAIGDPQTLSSAMNIPGGVLETLRQQGATGHVTLQTTLTVSALRVVSAPQYARPAASASP
ncbi:MAG TPA: DUF881 domain-containing protein [Kineosporiaceae bacterium]|nr:DUF881 domain-containing protein [Kineosporiaceae bacterium]